MIIEIQLQINGCFDPFGLFSFNWLLPKIVAVTPVHVIEIVLTKYFIMFYFIL